MKTIYALTQPGDAEGRTSRTVAHFTDKRVAEAIGRTGYGNESMGPSNGRLREIKVYESAEDFYSNTGADPTAYKGPGTIDSVRILRERALAKLSSSERRALGLE